LRRGALPAGTHNRHPDCRGASVSESVVSCRRRNVAECARIGDWLQSAGFLREKTKSGSRRDRLAQSKWQLPPLAVATADRSLTGALMTCTCAKVPDSLSGSRQSAQCSAFRDFNLSFRGLDVYCVDVESTLDAHA